MDDHLIHEPRIRRGRRPRVPGPNAAEPLGPAHPAGEAAPGRAALPRTGGAPEEAGPHD